MITAMEKSQGYVEFTGLKTDIKPIDELIANGSVFFEMDTGDVYMFDKQNQRWRLI